MTLLIVAKFFLENPLVAFRPTQVARNLKRPEKTIYRTIQILIQWQFIEEYDGLYILNVDTIEGKNPTRKFSGTGSIAILHLLLPGKSFYSGELRLLTGLQSLQRAKVKLTSSKLISSEDDTDLFGESFLWQLAPKIQIKLAQCLSHLRGLRRIYGK
ncbi:hypothetical protein JWG45_14530 [Leptospira sp. 201903070]|uniref:Transcriptional regulator n=1 Tax=Leptospira ainlahdjerensis TaxID=2810033 RepID=A0ABS2UDB9_9LEPT|nr:hypothetical protein [Leptospira ainlahdjerensis]MBM9578365.1 hypothetical protein [Leptospira ainlahdjerensis]